MLLSFSCCLKDKSTFPNIVGADDPRCPLGGLEIPESRTLEAYEKANCTQNFKVLPPAYFSVKRNINFFPYLAIIKYEF